MYLADAEHLVLLLRSPYTRGVDSGTGSPPGSNFLSKSERAGVTEGKLIALNKKRSLLSFQERIITPEMATFLRKLVLLNDFSKIFRPVIKASHHQTEMRKRFDRWVGARGPLSTRIPEVLGSNLCRNISYPD
jgi:hypothetical protein